MSAATLNAAIRLLTPHAQGAIAVVQIDGDVDRVFDVLDMAPVATGRMGLRDLCGVDDGVVARWSPSCAHLMPHGGPLVVERLLDALRAAGLTPREDDPALDFPEAADDVEALMLGAMSRAASPLAIDLLLDQPRRWRAWDGVAPTPEEVDHHSAALDRLIDPPVVVALGASNIGKSTLVNALAARAVSIVADEPGTTRDHVGVTLDLAGLVVRWVDPPGWRDEPQEVEQAALELARPVFERADLIALCADASRPFLSEEAMARLGVRPDCPVIRVGLRADLGPAPGASVLTAAGASPDDASGRSGRGLAELVAGVRGALVPDEVLDWPGPWRFDPRLRPPVAT